MDSSLYPQGSGGIKAKYDSTGNLVFRNASGQEIYRITSRGIVAALGGQVLHQRFRATAAEVNAGKVLLPAVPGHAYRLVDAAMIAIGGAAQTATSVDLLGTQAALAVRPLVVAVAALTQNTLVRAGATNATILAAGASFTTLDANTSISVTKQSGGSNLATATHIDVLLSYVVEAA